LEFVYETETEELPIMQVMNNLAFEEGEQGKVLDANFISMYNQDKKEFEYFIQRLVGLEIQNESKPTQGKLWVPYINSKKEDWSFLCEHNRIICREDEVLFRYEFPNNNISNNASNANTQIEVVTK
jgi:hypothetical protein